MVQKFTMMVILTVCATIRSWTTACARLDNKVILQHPGLDRYRGNLSASHAPDVGTKDKRWFPVRKANPEDSESRLQDAPLGSWPEDFTGQYFVRFCFIDKYSADHLYPYLAWGIAKYTFAMQVTGLLFGLDWGTGCDPHVYCDDERVNADAVNVIDLTRPIDSEETLSALQSPDCRTAGTVGYDYDPQPADVRGRHRLRWCFITVDLLPEHIQDEYSEEDQFDMAAYARLAMAHEIGMMWLFRSLPSGALLIS